LTVVVATGEDFVHHSHIMPLKANNIDSVGLLSSLPGIEKEKRKNKRTLFGLD